MSTSVLVVGATGYIGDGIARAFRRAGYRVYGLTRHESTASYLLENEIIPIVGDISKPESFKDTILESGIIIDGAGYVGEASKNFFQYVLNLKKATLQTYKTLYIFTSGIMTYYPGHFVESQKKLDETVNAKPTDPLEMVPKKNLEDYILSVTELRTVVIRPGFVYGGHGGVIAPLFFDVNPANKELSLVGRPDKRWSWVHTDDLGEAYVRAAKVGSVVDNQLFNISAPDHPTFEELKLASARAAGWQGTKQDIKFVPVEHPRQLNWETNVLINPQKAYDLLGWKPSHVGIINEIDIYYNSWKIAQQKKHK